ncbi:Uncharacterized protein SCF082_LOCUS2343 [Durusdinium trenchii]
MVNAKLPKTEDATAKTLSLTTASVGGASGGGSDAVMSPSAMGTSTALYIDATTDEGVFDLILKEIKSAGGPRQLIHNHFPLAASRPEQLGALLEKMVPPLPTQSYLEKYPIPACFPGQENQQEPIIVQLCHFSAENWASLREPPTLHVASQLVWQFCADGFVSHDEPVMIRIKDSSLGHDGPIAFGSIGFLKGAARVTTAIAIVVCCSSLGIQVPAVLRESLQSIKCKHIRLSSRTDELFFNMKKSQRGSIRKAPSAISWVVSLRNTFAGNKSLDPAGIIKQWNGICARSDRLVGAKAMSVTNLFQLPEKCLDIILDTVSIYGWEGCPFSDESLQSKKLLPSFNHKSARTPKGSPWQTRLRNTPESCLLTFQMVASRWSGLKNMERRKPLSRTQLEEKCAVCALACAVVDELAVQIPNVEAVLQEKFLKRLQGGDAVLEMDLLGAVEAKEELWVPRENACVMGLLNELSVDKKDPSLAATDLDGAKLVLDTSAMRLVIQELEYDEQCLDAYLSKLDSYTIRLTRQKQEWIHKRMDRAKTSVNKWFDAKVISHCWPEKIDGAAAINMMQQIEDSAKKWMQQLQLRTTAFLFVTNFAAPSLLKSEIVPCVLNLVGHMMSSHAETSAGVFLSPTFIWKGTLFQEEFGLLRTLSSAGCVVDTNFQLLFDIKSKVDARDLRPLAYPGRFLGPMASSLTGEWLWASSVLQKSRRTLGEAKQVPSKNMIFMEDLSPTSLPSMTSTIHGAQKHAQIGSDAAEKLLRSAVDGVSFPSTMGLVVVDLVPNVGHCLEGFQRLGDHINTPVCYMPVYSDMSHKEWSDAFWSSEFISLFQAGQLSVPGCERLQDDPPAEHLEAPPEPPALKQCTYGKVDGTIVTLEVPDGILKKYDAMPEFKTYHDGFLVRHPPTKSFKSPAKKNTKDTAGTTTPLPTKKRPREEDISGLLVDASAVEPDGDETLVEVPVVNARAGEKLSTMPILRVTQKVGPYILNQTGHNVTLHRSAVLCGFGKTKFREAPQDESQIDNDKEIMFEVTPQTYAILDGKFATIGEHLVALDGSKPNAAKISYHKTSKNPDGAFELEKEHSVLCSIIKEDESVKLNQSQAGKFLTPPAAWLTKTTTLGWQLKQSLNGLQPQRALILMVQDVTIPAGKAFLIQ